MKHTIEYLILAAGTVLCFIFLWEHSGGPVSHDELLYAHVSLTSQSYPEILNRYSHIYFQKLFFWVAGDPLEGVRIFWSLLISASIPLIYLNAKLLSRRGGFLIPGAAVLLFFSQRKIFHFSGVTYADFTQMFFFLIGFTIYTIYTRRSHRYRNLLLPAYGFILFMSVKANEIGICLAALLPGFMAGNYFRKDRSNRIINAALILAGVLSGVLVIALLDQVFNHDFLFQFRISHLRRWLLFNAQNKLKIPRSFLAAIFDSYLIIPFIFYVVRPPGKERNFQDKISWSLPLVILLFLTLAISSGGAGTNLRYLIPAIPVLCIWGSQFFNFLLSENAADNIFFHEDKPRKRYSELGLTYRYLALLLPAILLITILFYEFITYYRNITGWRGGNFYLSIILPVCLLSILILRYVYHKKPAGRFLIILLFTITIYNPIGHNFKFLYNEKTAQLFKTRLFPLETFRDKLDIQKNTRVFISSNIYKAYRMLGRDKKISVYMFNIFLNKNLSEKNIIYSKPDKKFLDKPCDYLFLTSQDFENILSERSELLEKYSLIHGPREKIVLLELK